MKKRMKLETEVTDCGQVLSGTIILGQVLYTFVCTDIDLIKEVKDNHCTTHIASWLLIKVEKVIQVFEVNLTTRELKNIGGLIWERVVIEISKNIED